MYLSVAIVAYLFERQRERHKKFSICWIVSQVAITGGTKPGWSQEHRTSSGSPTCTSPSTWAMLHCFPRHVSWKLDCKWAAEIWSGYLYELRWHRRPLKSQHHNAVNFKKSASKLFFFEGTDSGIWFFGLFLSSFENSRSLLGQLWLIQRAKMSADNCNWVRISFRD